MWEYSGGGAPETEFLHPPPGKPCPPFGSTSRGFDHRAGTAQLLRYLADFQVRLDIDSRLNEGRNARFRQRPN